MASTKLIFSLAKKKYRTFTEKIIYKNLVKSKSSSTELRLKFSEFKINKIVSE